MTKARDIADFKFEDIVDTGTEGTKIASGTTAQRGSTTGQIRFNSTTSKFEMRDASAINNVEFAPSITSIDDTEVDTDAGGNQTFVITGSNFQSGAVCSFVGNDGSSVTATSTTVNSATQITAVIAKSQFTNAKEPYDIKIVGANALIGLLENQIYVDNNPVWQTSAGAIAGSPFADDGNSTLNVQLSATDSDGDTITYSVVSGALPSGITLSSSGLIAGDTPNESGDTTYNFTVRATANSKTADRAFSMVVQDNAVPVWQTASGTILTVFDSLRSSASVTINATDTDAGDTLTYSIASGSLPTGMSLNTSTGVINGTPNAVGSDATSTFTARVTDSKVNVDREFSIVVKAPIQTVFQSSGTFTVPTGLTALRLLVVAGGGGGGTVSSQRGGGGGAGGVVHIPVYDITGASSYTVTVGNGGSVQSTGQNSSFAGGSKTVTANGGGAGKGGDHVGSGGSGGSGGGTWYGGSGGSATQPANTSDGVNTYNSTGYGNDGGNASTGSPWGSSGGGATGAGQVGNQNGGAGIDLSSHFGTSVGESGYFASGGNASTYGGSNSSNVLGGGGTSNQSNGASGNAQAYTGGGGGSGGTGGSGVVIVKY